MPRLLWPPGIALAAVVTLGGTSLAQMSEIDAYDRAVTSQSKAAAVTFLEEFRSSHLVGDLIESLRPEVAREVCAEIGDDGPAAARRACRQLPQPAATAAAPAAKPPAAAAAPEAKQPVAAAPRNKQPVAAAPRNKPPVAAVPETAPPPAGRVLDQGAVSDEAMSRNIVTVPVQVRPSGDVAEESGMTDEEMSRGLDAMPGPTAAAPAAATPSAVPPPQMAAMPGFRIQLLSTRSPTETQAGWQRLLATYPDLLGGLRFQVDEVNLGPAKGVWYRGFAGPIADRDEAKMLCTIIRSRPPHNDCFVAGY